jgi:hypothetical protein
MDTVSRKALRVIFKLHPKDVNGEVFFGDFFGNASAVTTHPSIQMERTNNETPTGTLDIQPEL